MTKCQCGADAVKLSIYCHSTWCPMYVKPPKIACSCGVGGWHSPGCDKRIWPEEPKDELREMQEKLKKCVEEIQKPYYNK